MVTSEDIMNNIHVDMNGKTPEMKFSDTIASTNRLSNFRTFGCPVYILDARLQSVGGEVLPNFILELVLEYTLVNLHLMLEAMHWL